MQPILFATAALILLSPKGSRREMIGYALASLLGLTVIINSIR